MQTTNFTNHFLIAMPGLEDANFYQSVTLICEHSDQGTMGIVINQPNEVTLDDVLSPYYNQNHLFKGDPLQHLYNGGPVEPNHGFVLHTPSGQWTSSLAISHDVELTTSNDILSAMANNQGPKQFLIALGYAGWGAGQLETELQSNTWLLCPADPDILFNLPPEKRWHAAAAQLGIDLNLLVSDAGHA